MTKQLDVVWLTEGSSNISGAWEYDYIFKDLLSNFNVRLTVLYGEYDQYFDNALIIYSCDARRIPDKISKYLDEYLKRKLCFSLFHLSNEQLNHDTSYYSTAKTVFRNYYDPNIFEKNVITVPLGYKSGFVPKSPLAWGQKQYTLNFIGQIKQDRLQLVQVIKSFEKKYIHLINQWDCPTSLSSEEMQDIFCKTFLIPCPMGNVHPETFRIYESLESGSLPVIKKYNQFDYYTVLFGNHPIPTVNSWLELPALVEALIAYGPDKKIMEVANWYTSYKQKIKSLMVSNL